MSTNEHRCGIEKLRRPEIRIASNTEQAMNVLGLRVTVERGKSRNKWTRRALILLAANGVVLGTGSAFAFWTSTGTGTASATTGTSSALTVSVTGISNLYPTETTTVPVSVTNTNPFKVALSSLVLTGVTPTGSGCNSSDITLDPADGDVTGNSYAVSTTLDESSGTQPTGSFNVPIAVANLADSCQGAGHSFSLQFTANGASTS